MGAGVVGILLALAEIGPADLAEDRLRERTEFQPRILRDLFTTVSTLQIL
jgi:hypothetical protein